MSELSTHSKRERDEGFGSPFRPAASPVSTSAQDNMDCRISVDSARQRSSPTAFRGSHPKVRQVTPWKLPSGASLDFGEDPQGYPRRREATRGLETLHIMGYYSIV